MPGMIRALLPLATAMALALACCGQKGPLKLPEPVPAKTEPGKSDVPKPATAP